jgi:dihydroxyacid dehydratase/phosphogluconate dehydratase
MSHFSINDVVIVDGSFNGTHDFEARVDHIYPEDSNKFGLIRVVDQDDDTWDVEPDEIRLVDSDDEHDQVRTDAEADQDALDSVYGADDDGCTCLGDE